MISEALEITIIVSMLVLVGYPSTLMVMEDLQEHRKRRVRVVQGRCRRFRHRVRLLPARAAHFRQIDVGKAQARGDSRNRQPTGMALHGPERAAARGGNGQLACFLPGGVRGGL